MFDHALRIRVFCALVTKISGEERELRLAEHLPGLTGLGAGVLLILTGQSCTLRSLSQQMMLTPATLIPVIDRLEQRGWLIRKQDPNDRRRNDLILTEAGRVVAVQIPGVDTQQRLQSGIQAMGEEKSRKLAGLLEELLRQMETEPGMVDNVIQYMSGRG